MYTIKRSDLVAWASGVLLSFSDGKGFAVNELACEEAERRMESGETILLVNNFGELTGTCMKLVDGVYVERKM